MGSLHHLLLLVVLLSFGLIQETVTSPDDRCQFIFKEDYVLDVGLSESQGAKVRTDLHAENRIKCGEACCESDGEWCTMAVFHPQSEPGKINCFLIQCVPDGGKDNVCVTNHKDHSGFMEVMVKHHIPTPKPQATEKPKVQTTEKSSTKSATEQTITTTNPTRATAKPTTEAKKADTTLTPKWTSPASPTTNQRPVSNTTQPINATQSGQERSKIPGEVNRNNIDRATVTQTGVLIVTLCFGIIFLLAMMVVVGKRWCEGYQRRKYNKVNYLINGYYS